MNAADLLLSAFAGAMVVISGGLYALLLALARLRGSLQLGRAAACAYAVLVVFALVLADRLELERGWFAVIAVMLVGYLLAPRAIWRLTEGTHRQ